MRKQLKLKNTATACACMVVLPWCAAGASGLGCGAGACKPGGSDAKGDSIRRTCTRICAERRCRALPALRRNGTPSHRALLMKHATAENVSVLDPSGTVSSSKYPACMHTCGTYLVLALVLQASLLFGVTTEKLK